MANETTEQPVFLQAREFVSEFLFNEISELAQLSADDDNQSLRRVMDFVIKVKRDINFYVLSEVYEFEEIWSEIRNSSSVTDFVMDVTNELILSLGVKRFNELSDEIANAYSLSKGPNSQMDEVLNHQLPENHDLAEILGDNPWIVPFYIIRHCDISDLLKK